MLNQNKTACVALEARFFRHRESVFTANRTIGLEFWRRYLLAFERVDVLARVKKVDSAQPHWTTASGEGVNFVDLPYSIGVGQTLARLPRLAHAISQSLNPTATYFLRLPSVVGSFVWANLLLRNRTPYAVEVVGDPWDVFSANTMSHPVRPLLRWSGSVMLACQCRKACAAAYVTASALQERYPPPESGYSTHYSTIDLPQDRIRKNPRSYPENKDGPTQLIFVGNLHHGYKGVDILIEALARVNDVGLRATATIVGDGPLRTRLMNLAEELKVENALTFTGHVTNVFDYLDGADLFILPSRQEGLPRAMIEAMARGLPSIGSKVGGIPELLDAADTFPADNAMALAEKIMEVIEDPSRMERMSRRNLARAANYTKRVLDQRRIRFYEYVRDRC